MSKYYTPLEVDIKLSQRIDNADQRLTEVESAVESQNDRIYDVEDALEVNNNLGVHVAPFSILSALNSSMSNEIVLTPDRLHVVQIDWAVASEGLAGSVSKVVKKHGTGTNADDFYIDFTYVNENNQPTIVTVMQEGGETEVKQFNMGSVATSLSAITMTIFIL